MKVITVARKPVEGTVAKNALGHGTGGINIDGSRIPFAGEDDVWKPATGGSLVYKSYMDGSGQKYGDEHHEPSVLMAEPNTKGRWPANVILTPASAADLDKQSGVSHEPLRMTEENERRDDESQWRLKPTKGTLRGHGASGGASRYFKVVSE